MQKEYAEKQRKAEQQMRNKAEAHARNIEEMRRKQQHDRHAQ